jgi:DNA-binding NarL/FixJ family response regulator
VEEPIAVAVIDANADAREGLVRRLRQVPGITVVGDASDPDGAVRTVEGLGAGIVVLDHRRMECDGVELVGRMTAVAPGVRILVLTAYFTERERAELLRGGARVVVAKEIGSDALVGAIREAAGRLP